MPSGQQAGSRLMPAGLIFLALIFRLAVLADPRVLDIDEVGYLVAAHHLGTGEVYSDWTGPQTHIHPLHPWLTSLGGRSPESLESSGRLVTLLGSVLMLFPLAALAQRLRGRCAANLVLFMLAVHPWLVRGSVRVQPESLYVLLVASALLIFLPEAEGSVSLWCWGAAGLLFGLSFLARPEGFLVGALAGGVMLHRSRRAGWKAVLAAGLFLGLLIAAASPYLLFLKRQTGEWVLTGKAAHVFFIGQALYANGGEPPTLPVYRAVKGDWTGAIPFIMAQPWKTIAGAAWNACTIGGSILPRGLGLLGFLGGVLCAASVATDKGLRGRLLLIASPSLTLLLMLFAFPEERVVASVVPFLLVLAAAGLASIAGGWRLCSTRGRAFGALGLAILAAAGWVGPAWRAYQGLGASARPTLLRAAAIARREAGEGAAIASDTPVLSFYAGDPLLFGPPGRYRPLPQARTCADLADALHERGARVAFLERSPADGELDLHGSECPLRIVKRLELSGEERSIWIVRNRKTSRPGAG